MNLFFRDSFLVLDLLVWSNGFGLEPDIFHSETHFWSWTCLSLFWLSSFFKSHKYLKLFCVFTIWLLWKLIFSQTNTRFKAVMCIFYFSELSLAQLTLTVQWYLREVVTLNVKIFLLYFANIFLPFIKLWFIFINKYCPF